MPGLSWTCVDSSGEVLLSCSLSPTQHTVGCCVLCCLLALSRLIAGSRLYCRGHLHSSTTPAEAASIVNSEWHQFCMRFKMGPSVRLHVYYLTELRSPLQPEYPMVWECACRCPNVLSIKKKVFRRWEMRTLRSQRGMVDQRDLAVSSLSAIQLCQAYSFSSLLHKVAWNDNLG